MITVKLQIMLLWHQVALAQDFRQVSPVFSVYVPTYLCGWCRGLLIELMSDGEGVSMFQHDLCLTLNSHG